MVLPIRWAWQRSCGSLARLSLSWNNNKALARECCAFSRRDFRAGSTQSPARGHTEPDLHGPGVAQRQSRAGGDGCAGSATETRLPHPQPQLRMVRMVRMVPGTITAQERVGMPNTSSWASREKQFAADKAFFEKTGENPDLNESSVVEATGLGTPC